MTDIEVFNPLDHGINNQPLMVPAHEYSKLLAIAKKLKDCIEDMRSENKIHGHITDASAYYAIHLKPVWEAEYENDH